mmetsp:Transcript_8768/g.12188  ORF Transcript_8768/g.12188 Transcript_8768/m.12188 type:complete len:620 (+) Transcript_8768:3-1862(+)
MSSSSDSQIVSSGKLGVHMNVQGPAKQDVSLFELLQLLELWSDKTESFANLKHIRTDIDTTKSSRWNLFAAASILELSQSIDQTTLLSALQALACKNNEYSRICRGFGTQCMTDSQSNALHNCNSCGFACGMRTVCLRCHEIRQFDANIDQEMPSTVQLHQIPPSLIDNLELLEQERYRAISAGIGYFCECARNKAVYEIFGGDLMFLLRNLLQTVGLGKAAVNLDDQEKKYPQSMNRSKFPISTLEQIAQVLHDACTKWLAEALSSDLELNQILDAVEALHVLQDFGIESGSVVPKVPKIMEVLVKRQDFLSMTNENFIEPLEKDITIAESTQSSRSAKKRPRRTTVSKYNDYEPLSIESKKRTLSDVLIQFDVTDLVGWNPKSAEVPMSDQNHCFNCGYENKCGSYCTSCKIALETRVDYGALTDGLVWSYLFEEVNIPMKFHNANFSFTDVLEVLPSVRAYVSDQIQSNFYKLQCYFLTHLLYVLSDWGKHSLRKDLFQEEYVFLVKNLPKAVEIGDPELVGEFIHCLRILDITKANDPNAWDVIRRGMLYLLNVERGLGSKGIWVPANKKVYDRYHAAFCGIVGLLVYDFYGNPLNSVSDEYIIPKSFRPSPMIS